jgi:hypothetical protein
MLLPIQQCYHRRLCVVYCNFSTLATAVFTVELQVTNTGQAPLQNAEVTHLEDISGSAIINLASKCQNLAGTGSGGVCSATVQPIQADLNANRSIVLQANASATGLSGILSPTVAIQAQQTRSIVIDIKSMSTTYVTGEPLVPAVFLVLCTTACRPLPRSECCIWAVMQHDCSL